MKGLTACLIGLLFLGACQDQTSKTAEVDITANPDLEVFISDIHIPNLGRDSAQLIDDDVEFKDVLAQYQALNSRLESISYRIQKANVDLCPRRLRSPGFTVHNVYDYPENLRRVAEELLPVSERLSLRTIKTGSPADNAGLLPGDIILELAGQYFPLGPTSKSFYEAASPRIYAQKAFEIKVRRGDEIIEITLKPETLCGYPVNVFFSERINGHTDGDEVWITSELLRSRADDVDVALVVAHEMAHAIAGHMDETPTKALELTADKMALIMLARAGFDYDRAVINWQNAPKIPLDSLSENSSTHPTTQERLKNFRAAQTYIKARQKTGKRLELE